MAKNEGSTTRSGPVLLVGAGRRPKELGACMSALGAVRAQLEGDGTFEPRRPLGLGDLEELLAQRPPEGTLILDYERVPGEDIGFVRRFLERHPEWQLVVLGDDARDPRARGLLALPRAEWLAWPPDLDQMGALLVRVGAGEAGGAGASPRARERRGAGERPEEVDVGKLLEELLASASLSGEGAPRYLFRADQPLPVHRDRATLAEGLVALLVLARRCAGQGGAVNALADLAPRPGDPPETARVRIDFPPGPLGEEDLSGLLGEPFTGVPELAADVERAQRGAATLRAAGCRVELAARRPDRLRFDVYVASTALEPLSPARQAARAGKAEDPFA